MDNPYFSGLPFRLVKGEILTIVLYRIIKRDKWLFTTSRVVSTARALRIDMSEEPSKLVKLRVRV